MASVADRMATIDVDRLPPQNLGAEAGVLGSMVLDNDAIPEVAAVVEAGDFYRDSHEALFRAIREVYDARGRVDTLLLHDHLIATGRLDSVGGLDAIEAIVEGTPHAANARHYAGIVAEHARRREAIQACNDALRDLYSGLTTAGDATAAALARLMAAGARQAQAGAVVLADALIETMEALARRRNGEVAGIGTGVAKLDDNLGGLCPGRLIVVGGRPGSGKSTLAFQFCARAAAEAGVPAAFLSFEMNRVELCERLLAAYSGVFHWKMQRGELDPRDDAAIDRARRRLSEARLYIDDTPATTLSRVVAAVRRYHASHGVGVVALDYLQLIRSTGGDDRGKPRHEVVGEISGRLKMLARELKIPVILCSQLNRDCEDRPDRRPLMSDLKASGDIEQDADQVILIHRAHQYDRNEPEDAAEAIVGKNRHGRTGIVRLRFNGPVYRFEDHDDTPQGGF